jgi:hypothetical protein
MNEDDVMVSDLAEGVCIVVASCFGVFFHLFAEYLLE